jgi:hypothetical protein
MLSIGGLGWSKDSSQPIGWDFVREQKGRLWLESLPARESGDRLLGLSGTVMSRHIVLLVAMTFITAFCSAQGANDSLRKPPMGYELYSWQESNGKWSFCLLASPSGPNISAEQVFNKKFLLSGVKELNRKISGLPVGATIFWLDRIMGTSQEAKESERLSYPPANMIDQVRQYAEKYHIEVKMSFLGVRHSSSIGCRRSTSIASSSSDSSTVNRTWALPTWPPWLSARGLRSIHIR